MIQPNLRVSILQRATTQFEQDRVSEAHTDDDLSAQTGARSNARYRDALGYMSLPQRTGSSSLP